MTDFPYIARISLLALLAAVMIGYDYTKHGSGVDRAWEYGFLFAIGLLSAVYGAIHDFITVSLSAAYFVVGKGIEASPQLSANAMLLGAKAGFSAGVIACLLWQYALRTIRPKERCLSIFKHVWIPVLFAVIGSLSLPWMFSQFDPFHFGRTLSELITTSEIDGFRRVWWIHLGSYSGLIAGVFIGIYLTRKQMAARPTRQ